MDLDLSLFPIAQQRNKIFDTFTTNVYKEISKLHDLHPDLGCDNCDECNKSLVQLKRAEGYSILEIKGAQLCVREIRGLVKIDTRRTSCHIENVMALMELAKKDKTRKDNIP